MATNPLGRLINLFFMTHRSLHKHMQEAKVITAFSFLQFITMKFVSDGGQASMKDLARFLSITPASATSLANGLVRMGVLERIADASDRRVILFASNGTRQESVEPDRQPGQEGVETDFCSSATMTERA